MPFEVLASPFSGWRSENPRGNETCPEVCSKEAANLGLSKTPQPIFYNPVQRERTLLPPAGGFHVYMCVCWGRDRGHSGEGTELLNKGGNEFEKSWLNEGTKTRREGRVTGLYAYTV